MKKSIQALLLILLIHATPLNATSSRAALATKGILKIGFALPLALVSFIQGASTYAIYTSPFAKARIQDFLYKIAQAEGAIAPGAAYLFYRGVKDLKEALQYKNIEDQTHDESEKTKKSTRSKKPTRKLFPTKKLFHQKDS